MAVLERESWLRWPTIIIDIICRKYCDKLTATIGPAKYPILLASWTNSPWPHPHVVMLKQQPSLFSSLSFVNKLFSISLLWSVSHSQISFPHTHTHTHTLTHLIVWKHMARRKRLILLDNRFWDFWPSYTCYNHACLFLFFL